MNFKFTNLLIIALLCLIAMPGVSVFGQAQELEIQEQRTASIKRMQERIELIKEEIDDAEKNQATQLGDEAFGLLGQIDQTYRRLTDTYQQRVVSLNERFKKEWQRLENASGESREAIDKKLESLQKRWDTAYQELAESHDAHLYELNSGLYKLRSKFYQSAEQAEVDLNASHFEAIANWERGHEILLQLNESYVTTVGKRLDLAWEKYLSSPDDAKLKSSKDGLQKHFLYAQKQLQQRSRGHLKHLEEEWNVRTAQLAQASSIEGKASIKEQLEGLCERKHKTYRSIESSLNATIDQLEKSVASSKLQLDSRTGAAKEPFAKQLETWQAESTTANESLKNCYENRQQFVATQLVSVERSAEIALGVQLKELKNRAAKLKELSSDLAEKASAIGAKLDK